MDKISVEDLPLKGKYVLVRVDFNVPLDKFQNITDDTRIRQSLDTINKIIIKGGIPILMAHLGRPHGKVVPELSLEPCRKRLEELLSKTVILAPDCIGPAVELVKQNLKNGEILLLENLRFHRAEEHPEENPAFTEKLADLGEYYVNDAFGTCHRSHASTVYLPLKFKGKSAAGSLLQNEINALEKIIHHPDRPFYAIIGGAKVSSKFRVLKTLRYKVDSLFIGGAMAYTFLKAMGINIGSSLVEDDYVEPAKKMLADWNRDNFSYFLPIDHVAVKEVKENADRVIFSSKDGISNGYLGVDIGPKTIEVYKNRLQNAKTAFWNGPLGIFEMKDFSKGTFEVAKILAQLNSATTVVGGGDSIAAIKSCNLERSFSHLSTGGGASLEYIEKGSLPGIEALSTNNQ